MYILSATLNEFSLNGKMRKLRGLSFSQFFPAQVTVSQAQHLEAIKTSPFRGHTPIHTHTHRPTNPLDQVTAHMPHATSTRVYLSIHVFGQSHGRLNITMFVIPRAELPPGVIQPSRCIFPLCCLAPRFA